MFIAADLYRNLSDVMEDNPDNRGRQHPIKSQRYGAIA